MELSDNFQVQLQYLCFAIFNSNIKIEYKRKIFMSHIQETLNEISNNKTQSTDVKNINKMLPLKKEKPSTIYAQIKNKQLFTCF